MCVAGAVTDDPRTGCWGKRAAKYGYVVMVSFTVGGVQLHFCTWPPDFCQMYMYKMYKNVQNRFFHVWKFPG